MLARGRGLECRMTLLAFALLLQASTPMPAPAAPPPSIDQLVELRRVQGVALSPDGTLAAYVVREANWDENAFETEIWLADTASGETRQLTRAKKSSDAPAFSPDGKRLAFGSDRGEKRQVFLIDPRGGEAEALTAAEEGVSAFAWSPDGATIAFTSQDPKTEAMKEREKRLGEYEVVDEDHRTTHLHLIEVASKKARRLTEGAFTVGGLDWAPDGSEIAFDHRRSPDVGGSGTADISIVTVADGKVRPLVTQAGPDSRPVFSPDGARAGVPQRDGPRGGLLQEWPGRGGAASGRCAGEPHRGLRREPLPPRLGAERHLDGGWPEDGGGALPPRPGHEGDCTRAARSGPDRLRLRLRPRIRARRVRRARARPPSPRRALPRPRAGPSPGSAASASR